MSKRERDVFKQSAADEVGGAERDTEWMRKALHDLCQPLTALQCRLFLGTMSRSAAGGEPRQELAELRDTLEESLTECERLTERVRTMQFRLGEDRGGR